MTGREQTISIEGTLSSEGPVTSGVPQGSSLGPLLFLIHIADIDVNVSHASILSFADDTWVTNPIKSAEDNLKMQEDLQHVYQWASDNNMAFNAAKFELLRYKVGSAENVDPYLIPDRVPITEVNHVKDLGVIMENSCAFPSKMTEALKRGTNMASWVLRVFKTRGEVPMMTLFRSMVVPHLEYCCQLLTPNLLKDIRSLEAIQRSFTARIAGVGHLTYWERLAHLQIFSLESAKVQPTNCAKSGARYAG